MPALIIFSLSQTQQNTHTHNMPTRITHIHGLKSSGTIIVTCAHKHSYQPQKNTQLTWIYTTVSNRAGPLAADMKGKHSHSWTFYLSEDFQGHNIAPSSPPPDQSPDPKHKTGQNVLTPQVKRAFCSVHMKTHSSGVAEVRCPPVSSVVTSAAGHEN